MPDIQLLRDYAEHGREAAFRELVVRYTDLVYSAALRQVESGDLAADIAQGVFWDLARKAGTLSQAQTPASSLAGWLHRATRYAALNHLRNTRRRRLNESQAMEQLLARAEPAVDWEQIHPVLDEALDSLDDADREALLLRYFKNQDFRTVGATLSISDDAAQKRVSRAVERLREYFTKHGVTVGAGGLTLVISANAVQAAPVGLATAISAAAILTGTTATTATTIAAAKIVTMTTLQKIAVTATVAALACASVYEARQNSLLREKNRELQEQQAPLTAQMQRLQTGLIDATNRLGDLLAENARLKESPEHAELLKLRGEVTRLKTDAAELARANVNGQNSTVETTAKVWVTKVNLLKTYLQQHPDAGIPEIQFMTDRDWLAAIDPTAGYWELATDDDYKSAMDIARDQAQLDFQGNIYRALLAFSHDTQQQFPPNLSALRSYLSPEIADVLEQQYELAPVNKLAPNAIPSAATIAGNWMIARKTSATTHGQRITVVPIQEQGTVSYRMAFY